MVHPGPTNRPGKRGPDTPRPAHRWACPEACREIRVRHLGAGEAAGLRPRLRLPNGARAGRTWWKRGWPKPVWSIPDNGGSTRPGSSMELSSGGRPLVDGRYATGPHRDRGEWGPSGVQQLLPPHPVRPRTAYSHLRATESGPNAAEARAERGGPGPGAGDCWQRHRQG